MDPTTCSAGWSPERAPLPSGAEGTCLVRERWALNVCSDDVVSSFRHCLLASRRWLRASAFRRVLKSTMQQPTLLLVLCASAMFRIAEACSARSTPRPRPPPSTMRPNITFHTYSCPENYATFFCLNGATCFSVKIGDSILYNCECADGYVGQRCQFKDLDGSYLPSRGRDIKTASIAGSVLLVIVLGVTSLCCYLCIKQRKKQHMSKTTDEEKPVHWLFVDNVKSTIGSSTSLRDPESGEEVKKT